MNDPMLNEIAPDPGVPTMDRIRRIWAHRGWIVLGGIVGVLATSLLSMLSPITYSAAAEVLVRNTSTTPFQSGDVLRQLSMRTEVQIGKSESVAQRASAILGGGLTAKELQEGLRVTNPTETVVLRFAYTNADAEAAAQRANAFANAYLEDRRDRTLRTVDLIDQSLTEQEAELAARAATLDQQIAALPADDIRRTALETDRTAVQERILDATRQRSELRSLDTTPGDVVRTATAPAIKDGPGQFAWIFLGGVLGVGAGSAMAWFRAVQDNRVRSAEDVLTHLRAPALAELPKRGESSRSLLVPNVSANDELLQAYRVLALQLTHEIRPPSEGRRAQSLLVVAPRSTTDADEVAANLGVVLAGLGRSVTLVEADLREPNLSNRLPVTLGDRAQGAWPMRRLEVDGAPGLTLAPGTKVRDIEAALSSPPTRYLLSGVDDDADLVVVVAPPLLGAFDAMTLTPMVDAVLVVCEPGASTYHDLVVAGELLSRNEASLLGAVLVHPVSRRTRLIQRLLPFGSKAPHSPRLSATGTGVESASLGREVYRGPADVPGPTTARPTTTGMNRTTSSQGSRPVTPGSPSGTPRASGSPGRPDTTKRVAR